MLKNVTGQKVRVFALDLTTGGAKAGDAANILAYVSKSNGAPVALGDITATEVNATTAKGWYEFDVSQAETNDDDLQFTGKSTTANVEIIGIRYATRVDVGYRAGIAELVPMTGIAQTGSAADITLASGQKVAEGMLLVLESGDGSNSGFGIATKVNVCSGSGTATPKVTLPSGVTWPFGNPTGTLDAGAPTHYRLYPDNGAKLASLSDIWANPTRTLTAILGGAMSESYAGAGVAPTPEQALFAIHQMMRSARVIGTTMYIYKLDGSVAFTLPLNAAYPAQLPTGIGAGAT